VAVSRVLDRVGQVLGGRYRLLAPIGTGASASVYLADDAVLRRRVAVKVLHAALADDEAFLRRFRAEAHAAAALNHPHVMAVYDWGQDAGGEGDGHGIPYLVTEHLGGGSLRAMLDQGALLTPSQALLVGLETARGLEYAHRRGFVHRDIKPANLLFDEDARLRIADFGLARALAEAAWTEPMGAVLGTARYASPEQARGESLDGKSDVYSLALVMIEAVTGRVPFSADTTIGTLMARVNQPLVVPDELGALAEPLRWAGNPDPSSRPDASEFGAALMAAAGRFDRPAPLQLAGTRVTVDDDSLGLDPTETTPLDRALAGDGGEEPVGPDAEAEPEPDLEAEAEAEPAPEHVADGLVGAPMDELEAPRRRGFFRNALPMTAPTDEPPTTVLTDQPPTAFARWGRPEPETEVVAATHRHPAVATTGVVVAADAGTTELDRYDAGTGDAYGYDGYDDGYDGYDETNLSRRDARRARRAAKKQAVRYDRHGRPKRARRRWPWVVLALVVALAAGAGGGYGYWYANVRIPLYRVPTLVGKNVAEVDPIVSPYKWSVERADRFDDAAPAGQVLDQQPGVGTEVPRGGTIKITVSSGLPPVTVPQNLVGLTLDEARAALGKVSLGVGKVEQTFDENVAAGVVLSLAPNTPAQVTKGNDVGLVVSAGPQPRTIPDGLVGKPGTSAIAALKGLGLVPTVTEEFSDSIVSGNVISIDPGVGQQAAKGSTVKLVVSKGPPLVEVPDVSGLSVEDAASKLEAAGFEVNDVKGNPRRKIDHTDPAAGTKVKPGSKITLFTTDA
jgi:serine/threonine-protein kinase